MFERLRKLDSKYVMSKMPREYWIPRSGLGVLIPTPYEVNLLINLPLLGLEKVVRGSQRILSAIHNLGTNKNALVRQQILEQSHLSEQPQPKKTGDIELGDDVKAEFPESWQQDTILRAWSTRKPTIGRRDNTTE